MSTLKVLNLYAGIGGNRKLWENVEVTAVEIDPKIAAVYKLNFPNDTVVVDDAHEYLLHNFQDYDFIWGSPPCPSHSRINTDGNQKPRYPEMTLYQEIIFLSNNWFKGKWCIENVIPYYDPLIQPTKQLGRHFYWSNFRIGFFKSSLMASSIENQNNIERFGFNVKGEDLDDRRKVLRNLVDPELGLYILNCARNIIDNKTTQLSFI